MCVYVCMCICVCKRELCVGWEWGTLVSQLLCVSLPTADPRAVNPASVPARMNTLQPKVRPMNHKWVWQEAIRLGWVGPD